MDKTSAIDEKKGLTETELLQKIGSKIKKLADKKLPQEEKEALKYNFKFWKTQPVPRMHEFITTNGPMAEQILPEDKQVPLPDIYSWCNLNPMDEKDMTDLYNFLEKNFIEDAEINVRPIYSAEMLGWYFRKSKSWCLGVKNKNKLIAFIGAVTSNINIYEKQSSMAEVNFLCVHKKLRDKRFTPVLINELVRIISKDNIYSAVFTSSRYIPKPIATALYHHRPLNLEKLIAIKFWLPKLDKDAKPEKVKEAFELPSETKTEGLRLMEKRDVTEVRELYESQKIFNVHPIFTDEEFAYVFLSPFVKTYVVETEMLEETSNNTDGTVNCQKVKKITDFISYYTIESEIMHHDTYKTLKSANLFYYAINITPMNRLVRDMLIMTKKENYDVFNALNIMENFSYLDDLKFEPGTGKVHYYFYNWLCPVMEPKQVGLCLI